MYLQLVILRDQPLAEVAQLLRELGHFLLAERRVVIAFDRVLRADVAYALLALRDMSLMRLSLRQECMWMVGRRLRPSLGRPSGLAPL